MAVPIDRKKRSSKAPASRSDCDPQKPSLTTLQQKNRSSSHKPPARYRPQCFFGFIAKPSTALKIQPLCSLRSPLSRHARKRLISKRVRNKPYCFRPGDSHHFGERAMWKGRFCFVYRSCPLGSVWLHPQSAHDASYTCLIAEAELLPFRYGDWASCRTEEGCLKLSCAPPCSQAFPSLCHPLGPASFRRRQHALPHNPLPSSHTVIAISSCLHRHGLRADTVGRSRWHPQD